MFYKSSVLTFVIMFVAILSILITVSSLANSPRRTSPLCIKANVVSPLASAFTRDNAKRNARIQWRMTIRSKYGSRYSDWAFARYRGYQCHKKWGRQRCRAIAQPCRKALPGRVVGLECLSPEYFLC